ncbi:MAG: 4Fe-4S dicluster domain-containing protein [Dehalococcoidia bacterium]|jgi:NAD-dependent dihydropyrimidine dehydrogenase PreA subunit
MNDDYTILASLYGYKDSDKFKKILKILIDKEEIKLINLMPATVEELAQKTNCPTDVIKPMVDALFKKGVIFESSKGYRPARHIFQLHDSTGSDSRSDQIWGRKLLDAWMDFSENELFRDTAKWVLNFPKPFSRVVPAMSSFARKPELTEGEDLESVIDHATKIAVVQCPCRRMAQKCDRPIEVCLQLNRGAEYAIKRGSGKEVSTQDAKKILQTASEAGLVHTVENVPQAGTYICNCCPDCCVLLYPWLTYGNLDKDLAKSRFEAKVDEESCSGFQDCVEQCPFGAIEMTKVPGQKKLKAKVNPDKCYGCGCCAVNCLTDSIKLYEVRPREFLAV